MLKFDTKVLREWQEVHDVVEHQVIGDGSNGNPRLLEMILSEKVADSQKTIHVPIERMDIKRIESKREYPKIILDLFEQESQIPKPAHDGGYTPLKEIFASKVTIELYQDQNIQS